MKDLRSASIASVLALALAVMVSPAAAQSPSPGSPTTQGTGAATPGKLPDESLAGQRQGAIGGGSVTQGKEQSGSPGTSSAPSAGSSTGTLPDNTLAGQRQGTIGGGSVSQGGAGSTGGSTEKPKQGSGQ